jgi:hypothetical protein
MKQVQITNRDRVIHSVRIDGKIIRKGPDGYFRIEKQNFIGIETQKFTAQAGFFICQKAEPDQEIHEPIPYIVLFEDSGVISVIFFIHEHRAQWRGVLGLAVHRSVVRRVIADLRVLHPDIELFENNPDNQDCFDLKIAMDLDVSTTDEIIEKADSVSREILARIKAVDEKVSEVLREVTEDGASGGIAQMNS